jgi:hypothetical protein
MIVEPTKSGQQLSLLANILSGARSDFQSPEVRGQLELPLIMVSCYRNGIRRRVTAGDTWSLRKCRNRQTQRALYSKGAAMVAEVVGGGYLVL